MRQTLLLLGLFCAAGSIAVAQTKPSAPAIRALLVQPASVQMTGPRAIGRFVVLAQQADGVWRDVTAEAKLETQTPKVLSIERNATVRALKDGSHALRFSYGGKTAMAKATVKDSQKATPVSFQLEVVPLFTRNGCNQGACHGAQYGKGGFKLSLAGFDPDLDYKNTVTQLRGRRISLVAPEKSLLLTKPAMQVPHGGGLRLEPRQEAYKLLAQWIREGATPPNPKDPFITKLEVFPAERVLQKGGSPQRLVVRAEYSDGLSSDVTAETRLTTLNDGVAACTPEGVVTPINRGQTAIMARYSGFAAVATIVVPFTPPSLDPKPFALKPNANVVDMWVTRKQRQLGLVPSPLCDDATFIRRVSLDLIGTLPSPTEAQAFLADKSADKRTQLVDRLLDRPEYADYWTLKWGDLLRSSRGPLGVKGMWSFTNWIRTQLKTNRPVNEMVHDLVLAQGSTFTNGPSNFYRVASNPQDLAETTSQVFLGVRLQCAKCHQHPFEKWSQKDYYQFAAFFARVGLKGSQEFGIFGNEQVVRVNDGGDVYHPKTGRRMFPNALGTRLADLPDDKMPNPDMGGDRRRALADWLTDKGNRLFVRNIANRYWGYLLGRGIANPIDDMRVTNPPTNPQLLDALADALVKSGFNLKALLRLIATSDTYQRSSQATLENHKDESFFTYYQPKRLPAEVLLDAIDTVCGTQEKFPELPFGTRAIQLPDPTVSSEFLDTFGRPQRLIACECERTAEPNISQTLRMMNGELVNRKASQGDGRIAKRIREKKSDDSLLTELYTTTLGRVPNSKERNMVMGLLAFSKDKKAVFEDVLVTLINSKEFLFNH